MKIEVCKGNVGLALYVDDKRVAGPRHNGIMETILSADVPVPPMTSDTPSQAERAEAWRSLIERYDVAMAQQKDSPDASLIIMANYGDLAINHLRALFASPPAEALPSQTSGADGGASIDPRKITPAYVVAWAVDRWNEQVKNRPLVNIHRRSLDDAWRRVMRDFGGDPDGLVGPPHDEIHAACIPSPKGDEHLALAKPASEPAGGGVAVKPLEWGDAALLGSYGWMTIRMARTPFGIYAIDQRPELLRVTLCGKVLANCLPATVEEAKVAAQADYEQRILSALSSPASSSPAEELHGPFGHLVIALGLDEEHWRIEDQPVNDADHVSLPMFTKVDPFKVALSDAGSDAEGRG